jgi:hypothetical protein
MMKIAANSVFFTFPRRGTILCTEAQLGFTAVSRLYTVSHVKCKKQEEISGDLYPSSEKVLVYEGAFAKRIINLRRISALSSLLTIPLIVSRLSFFCVSLIVR